MSSGNGRGPLAATVGQTINKNKKSTTIWYEEKEDNASQLTPSGTSSGYDQLTPSVGSSGEGQLTIVEDHHKYEYNFSHARRGIAHVFINKHFDEKTGQNERKGAEQDMINYSNSFKELGFEVKPYFDKTKEEIIDVFVQYADASHVDEDAVIFAFSTHGQQDVLAKKKGMTPNLAADIIYSKDACISVSTLTSFLTDKRCPSMANKPRLLFFQACRGEQLAETLKVSESGVCVVSDEKKMNKHTRPVEVPLHKDFFLAYSAPPGFYSFRRAEGRSQRRSGSWFVLALSDIIKERRESELDIDLMELVTALNHRMTLDPSHEFISIVPNTGYNQRMIVPWVASMLTKTVCFRNPKAKSS